MVQPSERRATHQGACVVVDVAPARSTTVDRDLDVTRTPAWVGIWTSFGTA